MKMTPSPQKPIVVILVLAALELFLAASAIHATALHPEHAVSRWMFFILAAGLGMACLALADRIRRAGFSKRVENFVLTHRSFLSKFSGLLLLAGSIALLAPSARLDGREGFLEQARPLLIVLVFLPFQFFIPWIIRKNGGFSSGLLKPVLLMGGTLGVVSGLITFTKFGITPGDSFWNVAGVPLPFIQLAGVLLTAGSALWGVRGVSSKVKLSPLVIDVFLALAVYLAGIWTWAVTPMVKHFFALRPAPPVFEYLPYSDARVHDLGALSILAGYGISFGEYTDKPLYMVFLSILHQFAGYDYNRLSLLHLAAMGLILPGLYLLGRQTHGRYFGLALAGILLVRQRNAIELSHKLAGVNPRLLMTEIPTLLGLVVLCIAVFFWIREARRQGRSKWPLPLLAGGILAATSLVRLNPIGLFPVIAAFMGVSLKGMGAKWGRPLLIFTLGFLLVLTPWVLTGRDAQGVPYLWVKFMDVLRVRYGNQEAGDNSFNHSAEAVPVKVAALSNFSPENVKSGDMQDFPAFVINHFAHNAVTAFLALPDSLHPQDQRLESLIQRPYLDERKTMSWAGELQPGQIPFLALNLILLAMGLGWSWRRWGLAGLFPALVFWSYILMLGLGRNSGSRYIVPVDWIIFFYYLAGLFVLVKRFTILLDGDPRAPDEAVRPGPPPGRAVGVLSILIVVSLSLPVPLAQIPVLTRHVPVCANPAGGPEQAQRNLLSGRVLYPYSKKKDLNFLFLTCGQRIETRIPSGEYLLQNGQAVLIEFSKTETNLPEAIFLEGDSALRQIWPQK